MKPVICFAILAMGLMGCVTESMDPYNAKEENGGFGKLCTQWVMREGKATEADSTATCGDGSRPKLYYTQWLTHSDECVVTGARDVVGGIKGVRRVFGCKK